MKIPDKTFLYGYLTSGALHVAIQDWLGQEAYIEICQTRWVHMSWGWGAGVALICAIAYVRARRLTRS